MAKKLRRRKRKPLTARSLTFRASSVDEKERSFEAVIATETPALVRDYETYRLVEEVLVADGGEFPTQIPLLDDHSRYGALSVLGSVRDFRRQGGQWIARAYFAKSEDGRDDRLEAIWGRVRDGHISDVSIGYVPREWVDIPAGTEQEVNGRKYKAGERTLRITTAWRAFELSVTPIGADSQAKIRSFPGDESPKKRSFFR